MQGRTRRDHPAPGIGGEGGGVEGEESFQPIGGLVAAHVLRLHQALLRRGPTAENKQRAFGSRKPATQQRCLSGRGGKG